MKDLENELEELKIKKDNPDGESVDEDPDISLIKKMKEERSEKKKAKKAKKKDKGGAVSRKLDNILGDLDVYGSDQEDVNILEVAKSIKRSTKKKNGKLKFDSDDFMDTDGSKRKKKKDLVKKYVTQFAPEMNLYKSLLKEATGNSDAFNKVFKEMTSTKVRGVSKMMTDLASTLVSANGNRLSIIKAMADLKAKCNDLAIKEETRKKDSGDGPVDQEAIGASFMQSLFSRGNNDFNKDLADTNAISDEEFARLQQAAAAGPKIEVEPVEPRYEEPVDQQNASLAVGNEAGQSIEQQIGGQVPTEPAVQVNTVQPEGFDPELEENLEHLNEELGDHPIYGRSTAGDNLIAFESEGITVKIRRWINDEGVTEWEFAAYNKLGDDVPEYELPNVKKSSPVKFNDDTLTATDKFGRSYEVIDLGQV